MDVEKVVKDKVLEACNEDDLVVTAGEALQLIDRLKDYRKRLRDNRHSVDKEMAPLLREIHDHRECLAWARRRLDPEDKGTHYSVLDQYEVADLLQAIDKIRGKVVASRLLYGAPLEGTYAEETLGVLRSAIECALEEQKKWRSYLKTAQGI